MSRREARLPQVRETDWRDALPLHWGKGADGATQHGYRTFPVGAPDAALAAVIWYEAESDTVVIHHNDRLTGPERAQLDGAVTALRREVASW